MKTPAFLTIRRALCAVTMLLSALSRQTIHAQGTAFTYQGRLSDGANPANGNYDLQFYLRDAFISGGPVGTTNRLAPVVVSNGLFSVSLDFGLAVFNGSSRWLEIGVRTNGSVAAFAILAPRQALTPSPYAILAGTASTVTGGAISNAQIAGGQVVKSLNGLTDAVTLSQGANVTLATNGSNLTISSSGSGSVFSLNGTSAYYNAGNVGIGTTSPGDTLEIDGAALLRGDNARLRLQRLTGSANYLDFNNSRPLNFRSIALDESGANTRMTIATSGNVGIGTTSPLKGLQVGDDAVTGSEGMIRLGSRDQTGIGSRAWDVGVPPNSDAQGADAFDFVIREVDNFLGDRFVIQFSTGNVGIGTTSPQAPLDVQGETRTCVLTITGGCDVSEPFKMSSIEIPKGAVVIIDEQNAGALRMSDCAYDTRVAGIVSGANGIKPGISLSQQGVIEGGENVALSGRVYALADASYGSIQPGDLLTTSDRPGHCMKATDHIRAQGAIIGKAMSPLKAGRGMVLVLVSLQ